jgi:hypothetical protein
VTLGALADLGVAPVALGGLMETQGVTLGRTPAAALAAGQAPPA